MIRIGIVTNSLIFILVVLLGAGLYETDRKLRVLKREVKEMDDFRNVSQVEALRLIHEADQRKIPNESFAQLFGDKVRVASENLKDAPELDEVSSRHWNGSNGHMPYENFSLWDGRPVPYHPYQGAADVIYLAHAYAVSHDQAQLKRAQEMLKVVEKLEVREKCDHPMKGMANELLFIPYPFDFMVGSKIKLASGWVSAFSQGTWLAAYLDLYDATKEMMYLDSARQILASLACVRGHVEGGSKWAAFIDDQNYLWFEEYPYDGSENSIQVLNGHIWTVRALYKWHRRFPEDTTAETMLRAGIATVRSYAHFYRHPGNANFYDLLLLLGDYSVDRTLIDQDWLAKVTGDSYFSRMKKQFEKDVKKEL